VAKLVSGAPEEKLLFKAADQSPYFEEDVLPRFVSSPLAFPADAQRGNTA
jgi:hypothetical protein